MEVKRSHLEEQLRRDIILAYLRYRTIYSPIEGIAVGEVTIGRIQMPISTFVFYQLHHYYWWWRPLLDCLEGSCSTGGIRRLVKEASL